MVGFGGDLAWCSFKNWCLSKAKLSVDMVLLLRTSLRLMTARSLTHRLTTLGEVYQQWNLIFCMVNSDLLPSFPQLSNQCEGESVCTANMQQTFKNAQEVGWSWRSDPCVFSQLFVWAGKLRCICLTTGETAENLRRLYLESVHASCVVRWRVIAFLMKTNVEHCTGLL